MNLRKLAVEIINNSLYLSLATSVNNDTWVTPLWYATDKDYNFYFVSDKNTKHVTHLIENQKVAFCIFDSNKNPNNVTGLQVSAIAKEINLKEIPGAIKCIFSKNGSEAFKEYSKDWNKVETYSKLANTRIYKLIPTNIWILDINAEEDNKRVEVKL
jgi:uncharacterized protein YhbP (UPF0306 family)